MSVNAPQKGGLVIESSVLKWARKSIGLSLDEAVQQTKLDKDMLESWENIPSPISVTHLKKLSKAYKRPVTVFFLQQPPDGIIPPDFRTLDSVKIEGISQEARLAIRKAQRNRIFYTELIQNAERFKKEISLRDDVPQLAEQFRKYIGINIKTQTDWESEHEALNTWIDGVEKLHIPVFQLSLPIEEFRGFCLRGNDLVPAVVINQRDFPRGRIFTLLHELYHVFLKQTDINNLVTDQGEKKAHKIIELQANDFAGSFLVPRDIFLSLADVNTYKQTKDSQLISKIKKYFNVSEDVIYRRLATFGIISESEYVEKQKELNKMYARLRAEQKAKQEKSNKPFIPNFHREVAYKAGFDLGKRAFDALNQGRVSAYDLVNFFGVKTNNLGKVKKYIDLHYQKEHRK